LTVASLSEIFTQDIEDFVDEKETKTQQPQQRTQPQQVSSELASEAQQKMIYAKMRAAGYDDEAVKIAVQQRFGVDSVSKLTKHQASEFIQFLSTIKKQDQ